MADLKTTFAPDKSMVVTTPGASAPAFPPLTPDLIVALLGKSGGGGPPRGSTRGRRAGSTAGSFGSAYAPKMGTQHSAPVQSRAPITRMRRVRKHPAIPAMQDLAGITYQDMQETQLPDGTWSLDAVHGTLEGNARRFLAGRG